MSSAILDQSSVRWTQTQEPSPFEFTVDAARSDGTQVGSGLHGSFTIVLTSGTAYFKADETAMSQLFGFQPPNDSKYANQWIYVTSGQAIYRQIVGGLTVATVVPLAMVSAPYSVTGIEVVGGVRVVGVHGGLPAVLGESSTSSVPSTCRWSGRRSRWRRSSADRARASSTPTRSPSAGGASPSPRADRSASPGTTQPSEPTMRPSGSTRTNS
jgi:hypothetical protein